MELNECINFLLTRAQQTVFQYVKANLSQFDVTPAQYGILKCLWNENGQTPKQIAKILSLDGSTITGVIDRMESKGLVIRTPDPDDRRTLKVIITDKGLELREQIEKVIEEVNEYILEIFTRDEQEQLKKFLELIANRQTT